MARPQERTILSEGTVLEGEVTRSIAIDDERPTGERARVAELVAGEPKVARPRGCDVCVVRVLADHRGTGVRVRPERIDQVMLGVVVVVVHLGHESVRACSHTAVQARAERGRARLRQHGATFERRRRRLHSRGIEPIGVPRALAGSVIPFTYGNLEVLEALLV